ncbi:UxaA family hydrolase [Collinsella tanakaei]|uniref:UxaA family hydrolase n=1 Tax=Collinsella tanakaei TaxID=626935 RepID=UPI0025A35219|nr:altronate dehydratase family protein [Collinsella tanakaei]MDM8300872.1 altronate dehydratase family protein [Collinsella tanakaei]
MGNAVVIDEKDNVAIAIVPIGAREQALYTLPDGSQGSVDAVEDIPLFHKIARVDIARGERVIKYGEYIGVATEDIAAGSHVHVHNCASTDALKGTADAGEPVACAPTAVAEAHADGPGRTFMGYRRSDGRVGIRNHVLILPTSICASDTTERIARAVEGCVTFHNQNGCSQVDIDQQVTIDTLAGLAANPNVHSVLAVSLGCEGCQNDLVVDAIRQRTDKPVRTLIIQQVGGSIRAVEEGTRIARELACVAARERRVACPVSELILGTNCGGSDTSSGLGANPLIGEVSDWLVAQGGTSVLCETPELFGGEHILARRAKTSEVAERILGIVADYEKYVQLFGAEMREGNPSPGNMAGGLTTLEEKSLGCIHKGGHAPISAVYPYAAQLAAGEGLVVMDTPGNDPSSVGGIVAGGCQLVVFSTGLGTPTGNAIAPVLRLTANRRTAQTMADNTDFDASASIYGPETMRELRDALIDQIIDVCNGTPTCAEALGYTETALPHICNYM